MTTELLKKIDYTKTSLEDRKQIVEEILKEGNFEDYFDNQYKARLGTSNALSEHNSTCLFLEKLANYLLNADEVKKSKKKEKVQYKFYVDEDAFKRAVSKEPKLDSMANGANSDNIIHFLKQENRNFKKSKKQKITKKDLNRDDELGQILREYADYLEKVTQELINYEESKLSRFKLSEISSQVKDDMIKSKDILLGVFGYKTNHQESTKIDWSAVDFTNYEHARALLYLKPGYRYDEDLMFLIDEFDKLYQDANPTKLQKQIVELMRENMGLTEIGNNLNIPKQNVDKNIKMLVQRICKLAAKRRN